MLGGGGSSSPPAPKPVTTCDVLKNGKNVFIKSIDGRYVVLDTTKQLAFIRQTLPSYASQFTVSKKSCNSYGLCVGSACMSRCSQCTSDIGDAQTVKFQLSNSDSALSRWTLTTTDGSVGGPYMLQADSNGYLTYKKTTSGEEQLTLSTSLTATSLFNVVEAQAVCGLLKDGVAYWIMNEDGYVVYDATKKLAYTRRVSASEATKFIAIQKDCNLFGFCAPDGQCLSRCFQCTSDLGDELTVKLHTTNTDFAYNQWRLTPVGVGGGYYLQGEADNHFISTSKTPDNEKQLTMSENIISLSKFIIVDAA